MVWRQVDIHIQKNEIRPSSYTIIKINSRWIKGLTLRCEIIKLLEVKVENMNYSIDLSNAFQDMNPTA
jgi:hypothetical protein